MIRMYPIIHEQGDEALRPTNKPWKCRNCGIELLTVSTIEEHEEKCTEKKTVKPQRDLKREKLLEQSLKDFKQKHRIK